MRLVLLITLILACTENKSVTHEAVTQHAWFKNPRRLKHNYVLGIFLYQTKRENYISSLSACYMVQPARRHKKRFTRQACRYLCAGFKQCLGLAQQQTD